MRLEIKGRFDCGVPIINFGRQIKPIECIIYKPDQLQNINSIYNTFHVWQ